MVKGTKTPSRRCTAMRTARRARGVGWADARRKTSFGGVRCRQGECVVHFFSKKDVCEMVVKKGGGTAMASRGSGSTDPGIYPVLTSGGGCHPSGTRPGSVSTHAK